MLKRASPVLIGIFVISAFFLAVVSILVFGSKQLFTRSHKFILYFEESVKGLEEGAPIKFKGVPVGRVSEILIHFDSQKGAAYIPIVIEIDSMESFSEKKISSLALHEEKVFEQQVKNGLRARLDFQSYFTGLLFVELNYYPEEPPVFFNTYFPYKEIPTIKSGLDELWADLTSIVEHLRNIDFKATSESLITAANKFKLTLDELNLKEISTKLVTTLDTFKEASESFDGQIQPFFKRVSNVLQDASEAFEEGKRALAQVGLAGKNVSEFIQEASGTKQEWDIAFEEIAKAARSVRKLSDLLERNPKALIAGKKIPSHKNYR